MPLHDVEIKAVAEAHKIHAELATAYQKTQVEYNRLAQELHKASSVLAEAEATLIAKIKGIAAKF
jgi:hypothetical protein